MQEREDFLMKSARKSRKVHAAILMVLTSVVLLSVTSGQPVIIFASAVPVMIVLLFRAWKRDNRFIVAIKRLRKDSDGEAGEQ